METIHKKIIKYNAGVETEIDDEIAIEKPLKILVNGKVLFDCLRTPVDDLNLALGLCFTNGVITSYKDIVKVNTDSDSSLELILSLNAKSQDDYSLKKLKTSAISIDPEKLLQVKDDFLSQQKLFKSTGATHAAAIYDDGFNCLAFAEDVGRHNALDKCIGKCLILDQIRHILIIFLSSRISCEIVAKVSKIGKAVIIGTSAPTSLAIETAAENDITLIGFMREKRFNVYTNLDFFKY
jgi:FdhD protein